jgi:hypothetical protein
MLVDDTIWEGFQSKSEFNRRNQADRESYVWNRLIEITNPEREKIDNRAGPESWGLKQVCHVMARQNRFSRCIFGRNVRAFMNHGDIRSRIIEINESVLYVFVVHRADETPNVREAELVNRSRVAKTKTPNSNIIIGVGVDALESFTLGYLDATQWSAEGTEPVQRMQETIGYFKDSSLQVVHGDECPAGNSSNQRNFMSGFYAVDKLTLTFDNYPTTSPPVPCCMTQIRDRRPNRCYNSCEHSSRSGTPSGE